MKEIQNLAWVLPRPRHLEHYAGGFPLHFEKLIYKEIGINPRFDKILHPFGGRAEIGYKLDLKRGVKPDIIGDAHYLPFKDEIFDCVIIDPPYTEIYAKRLYGLERKPKFWTYINEAVRVLKDGGILVIYHYLATPVVIPNCVLIKRIFLETRIWHKLRCIRVHKKFVKNWMRDLGHKGLGLQTNEK